MSTDRSDPGIFRATDLEASYAASWDEWSRSEDAELWDTTSSDGLGDGAR